MKRSNVHGKLLGLLYLLPTISTSLVLVPGCGLLVDEHTHASSSQETYDQLAETFNQIVPGMTNAQDLPNLGFDPKATNADVLSYTEIEGRFEDSKGHDQHQHDPAVRACIQAKVYCTGYVFGSTQTSINQIARWIGFEPFFRKPRWHITFLVMDGRVVYKSLS
jgi:hypothetical protein